MSPAAMTKRLVDAAIYAESASGVYVGPARKEVNEARAAIEFEIERLTVAGKHLAVKLAEVYRAAGQKPGDCQAIRDWMEAVKGAA